ncbi:MAG: response regulator transcription factor, partial [Lentisphaerae bacterium]|nr:response regulator transcription factor [Lentisphaerota bacterium]
SKLVKKIDCEVVGEAQNGAEAVSLYRTTKPDLVLMDVNMPVKTGEEALKEILDEFPQALIIMLSSVIEADSIRNIIGLGAAGYIRKDSPMEEIKSIIRENLMGLEGYCE